MDEPEFFEHALMKHDKFVKMRDLENATKGNNLELLESALEESRAVVGADDVKSAERRLHDLEQIRKVEVLIADENDPNYVYSDSKLELILTFWQTLRGPFSAVSKQILRVNAR